MRVKVEVAAAGVPGEAPAEVLVAGFVVVIPLFCPT